jgi:hypothetical protein
MFGRNATEEFTRRAYPPFSKIEKERVLLESDMMIDGDVVVVVVAAASVRQQELTVYKIRITRTVMWETKKNPTFLLREPDYI